MLVTWVVLVLVVVTAWLYSRWRHSYWASRGVPSPPALPFIGHLHQTMSPLKHRWLAFDKMYHTYKNSPYFGLYEGFSPVLMVCDPDILKNIFVKDFDHFVNRRPFRANQPDSYMSNMLGSKKNQEWKDLRAVLSPTFSTGKMRMMFQLMCDIADTFVSSCLRDTENYPPVNMKDKAGQFTMDTMAFCAFGIECNSLTQENPLLAQKADSFFTTTPLMVLKLLVMRNWTQLFNALGLKEDPEEVRFFRSVAEETIRARQDGKKRGDFLDLLLEARAEDSDTTTASPKHVLTDKVMVALCILFLLAGYDTIASAVAFSSHLLAKNPEPQQRLRQELEGLVKEEGELTYQGVMEAKFLDACVMESLRIYPPALFVERMCTKDYSIPGTNLHLKEGDGLHFPVWSLHHDPRYWPDPEQFQPDRFLPENKVNIKSFTHMPFGMGPRNCLAMRFALMETKVALAKLILAADLRIPPGHENIEMESSPFMLRPKHGVYILLTPRKHE